MSSGPRVDVAKQEGHLTDLGRAFAYILFGGLFVWAPLVFISAGLNPFALFTTLDSLLATLMYFTGAVLASSTAVGGGIVFNPMLQLIFQIGGLSALSLAIVVQCAGMVSGTYGWYTRGTFQSVDTRGLLTVGLWAGGSTLLFSFLLVLAVDLVPIPLLLGVMKVTSAMVSFYVARLVWKEIRTRKRRGTDAVSKPRRQSLRLSIDWRICPWIVFGAVLNVTTAVGMGALTFSHVMKYYRASAPQSIALGVLAQAVSVVCQTAVIAFFMANDVIVPMVCIGLLIAMAGGRLAPYIMTRPIVEPYIGHALALTAIGMGVTSLLMLILAWI